MTVARLIQPVQLIGIAALALMPALLAGCENPASDEDTVRQLSQMREEMAAQRARIDGIVDRLDRVESVLDREAAPEETPPTVGLALPPSEQGPLAVELQTSPTSGPLTVKVAKRSIVIGEDKLDKDSLTDRLASHVAKNPQAAVILRVASGVSSGRMTEIADIAKEQGITQIAVVREGTAKKNNKKKKRRKKRQ